MSSSGPPWQPPTPEEFAFGLHGADNSFIMPPPDPENPMGYMLDAGLAIARTAGKKIVAAGVDISFGNRAAQVVEVVAGANLFDTTLARMYDTVGDVAGRTALLFLEDAAREPDAERRDDHRNRAAGALGASYRAFSSEAAERSAGLKGLITSSEATAGIHRKAAGAALGVALINYHMGSGTAAATWADYAQDQYTGYYNLRYKTALVLTAGRDAEVAEAFIRATEGWNGRRLAGETARAWGGNAVKFTAAGILQGLKQAAHGNRPVPPPALYYTVMSRADLSTRRSRAAGHQEMLADARKGIARMHELAGQQARFDALYAQLTGRNEPSAKA